MKKIGLIMLMMGTAQATTYTCCIENYETETNQCYENCGLQITSEDGDNRMLHLIVPRQRVAFPTPTPVNTPSPNRSPARDPSDPSHCHGHRCA